MVKTIKVSDDLELSWTEGFDDFFLTATSDIAVGAIDLRDIEAPTVRLAFIQMAQKLRERSS